MKKIIIGGVIIAQASLLMVSCSGNAKQDKAVEHKPDSLVIKEVIDTAYVPVDPKDPTSPLIPKLLRRQDTIQIKR
jgi:hypothetical protein